MIWFEDVLQTIQSPINVDRRTRFFVCRDLDDVMENRRMADGYRFNNEDLYARSLTEAISIDEYGF
jgi:hypothetical protein